MNSFNPLVSIVIPVHNGSNYMAEAIDSALAQTYSNIEVLVINDGSKDDGATRNIALSYGNKIKYFEKENGGVATALNLGIEKMQGEYFSWLSHDDAYFADKIEKQINYLSQLNNKTVVLYSDFEYIDENSTFISLHIYPHYPPEKFRPAFIKDGIISGCTLIIPKVCFGRCGVFNPALQTTQDYDLWFRISERYEFIHIPKPLIKSRLHDGQDTRRLKEIVVKERDYLHLNFIKKITDEEVNLFTNGNIASYFISFASTMTAYMCVEAERHAISRASNNLFRSTLSINSQNTIRFIILYLFIGIRNLFILIFGFDKFVKLKKIIRLFRLKMFSKQ